MMSAELTRIPRQDSRASLEKNILHPPPGMFFLMGDVKPCLCGAVIGLSI